MDLSGHGRQSAACAAIATATAIARQTLLDVPQLTRARRTT